jgi:hypothetical protein
MNHEQLHFTLTRLLEQQQQQHADGATAAGVSRAPAQPGAGLLAPNSPRNYLEHNLVYLGEVSCAL